MGGAATPIKLFESFRKTAFTEFTTASPPNGGKPPRHRQALSPRGALLRSDAITVECGLLLQGGDDVLAVDRLLGAAVVQERLAFQFRLIAFANEGETEELQGFTVDVQARARG